MKQTQFLLNQLKNYSESEVYPFHMPGHKRQCEMGFAKEFPNPFSVDITEIEGFDDLHHPEGILKKSMEWAASLYGADRTYYLVNGSSCGILSAICGTTNNSDTILLGRNSHKSAYHGVFLNHLQAKYTYPQILVEFGVQGGLLAEDVEKMLKTHSEIKAVFVVSPTYDGIVSDIKTIATIARNRKIPLIVDEAHGAHFRYGTGFPVSALELGADVVIQSLHKTLPSFTQTALLHVKSQYVDIEKLERYLQIYQSSSPSYLFLAGIENAIGWMEKDGRGVMEEYFSCLLPMRRQLGKMKYLKLLDEPVIGHQGVYDLDRSKVVISTRGTTLDGVQLKKILREQYALEMEMCSVDSVTAITTVADTPEGLLRLEKALLEIDETLGMAEEPEACLPTVPLQAACSIFEAFHAKTETVSLAESVGRISAEFIYVYPPGIPFVVPGELISEEVIQLIHQNQKAGLSIQGLKDLAGEYVEVTEGDQTWVK